MIVVKEFPDKQFETKEELFKALKENKKELISLKKSIEKRADPFNYVIYSVVKNSVNKEESSSNSDVNELQVKVIINTTNFTDSHNDIHIFKT